MYPTMSMVPLYKTKMQPSHIDNRAEKHYCFCDISHIISRCMGGSKKLPWRCCSYQLVDAQFTCMVSFLLLALNLTTIYIAIITIIIVTLTCSLSLGEYISYNNAVHVQWRIAVINHSLRFVIVQ